MELSPGEGILGRGSWGGGVGGRCWCGHNKNRADMSSDLVAYKVSSSMSAPLALGTVMEGDLAVQMGLPPVGGLRPIWQEAHRPRLRWAHVLQSPCLRQPFPHLLIRVFRF